MITHEQDPDVVRWGLQLFESDPYSNCGYCGTIAQDDTDSFTGKYFKEDQCDLQSYNVESDERIGHAFQAQLGIGDLPESPHEGEEHSEACAFQQGWLDQSIINYGSGQEGQEEEIDEMLPPSSCSSPQEMAYGGQEWSYPLKLADEYAFDGGVEKWLNQMVSVPHVPRINGEIPSIDEATLDHQRLLDRLQVYDLVERKVDGDGNCQFRALSDQFYRTAEHHEFVRQQVVNQLKSYPEIYEGYVPMAYGDYLEKMSKNGEWGDHVTLRAVADSYGVKIFVITSFKDTCYIEILPNVQRSKRDLPAFGTKRKKKWEMLQNVNLELPDEYQ
ncbi:OVARIAN TUMOR DOMAIN-containing deubiquitinating enzyme 9-like isoform X2 [Tripterygium wilfordii]|uniref:OVARIAN TUMOR DOMAIN-containing deubiquitinating enzyme 9-like isoform X2 n=1 Tax=Tripterygium wilfordii TaxID=458696 RepID=UPI0018F85C59|nr:OVARIAN TUMOR DOMAIN-containing deubiquitinating enzyme 9-like isoform X2 [Tripterygium wilfordii]